MKKILILCFVIFCVSATQAFSVEVDLDSIGFTKEAQMQQYISNIGFNILNSNRIDKRMVFLYKQNKKDVNACTYFRDRSIHFNKGLAITLESDDEYAAVLAHEISHGVDLYDGIFRGFFSPLPMSLSPKKYERKADKRAVDYMVKAGYNPLAMIVVMNKDFSQTRYDWLATHPLPSRRMAYVYEYIYRKYPEYLVNNKYKDNIYYQNFLLNSRENRLKLQKRIESQEKTRKPVSYL